MTTAVAGYNAIRGGAVIFCQPDWGVNKIIYLKVDLSRVKTDRNFKKVTLSAECSGSTDSRRITAWGVGYNNSTWSADMTYNTADKSIMLCAPEEWTTTKSANTFETLSWDITDAFVGGNKVATLLVYETNAGGGYFKNPTVKIEKEGNYFTQIITPESPDGTIGTLAGRDAMVVDLGEELGKVAIAMKNVGATSVTDYGTGFTPSDAINYTGLENGWYIPSKVELEALNNKLERKEGDLSGYIYQSGDSTLLLPCYVKEDDKHVAAYVSSSIEGTASYPMLSFRIQETTDYHGILTLDENFNACPCAIRPFHKLPSKNQCIYYTSSDSNVVDCNENNFNDSILGNNYENGQGIFLFSDELTSIGEYAFSGQSTLTSVALPTTLKSIGYKAFNDISSLTTLTLAEGSQLETIRGGAFQNTGISGELALPASVTSIGNYAFGGCSNLTTLTFAEGSQLETIGVGAFQNTGISGELTIPASVTTIGEGAFSGCSLIINMSGDELDGISNLAFSNNAVIRVPMNLYEMYKNHFSNNKVEVTPLTDWQKYTIHTISITMAEVNTISNMDKKTIEGYIADINDATTFGKVTDAYNSALGLINQQKDIEATLQDNLGTFGTLQDGPAIEIVGKDGKTLQLYNIDKVNFIKSALVKNTVTFLVGEKEYKTQGVKIGTRLTKPQEPTASDGMKFAGWTMTADGNDFWDFNNAVTEDMTLYAKFAEIPSYTVTFLVGENEYKYKTQGVKSGTCVTKPQDPTAPDDMKFVGWATDADGEDFWDFKNTVTGNMTLYAVFIYNGDI